ncbi:SAM-dependent methyltransferase-like protein, partial [Dinothrombium tinctorium]
FHYIENLSGLLAQIHRALTPGGHLIFSAEHPFYTASMNRKCWWINDENGRKVWPIDSYSIEGKRTRDWFAEGVVKFHRTLDTYTNMLISTGFTIRKLVEFAPSDEQIEAKPWLTEEKERPMFFLMKVTKQ